MNLELKVLIINHDIDGDSVSIIPTVKVADSAECESYKFDLKTYLVRDFNNNKLFRCDKNKIKKLEIDINGIPGKPFSLNLNDFDFTKTLRLPNLEKLKLKLKMNSGPIKFNFNKWVMYQDIIKSQSLKEIYVDDYILNKNWFDAFLVFKNLRKIKIQDYLSDELKELPNLEVLNFPFMYNFFCHSIAYVSDLAEMPSLANKPRGSDIYPQVTFFANSLSPEIKGHPYYEINKCLQHKLSANPSFSGTITLTGVEVYEKNLPDIGGYGRYNYPVAYGEVKNGEPIGVWQFKIPSLEFLGPQWFYYNYNDTLNTLPPKEGRWNYYYPDGKTAITGNFKNGIKHGEWKFYNPDETLNQIKHFEKGYPKGLFIDFLNPRSSIETVEKRSYYFNSRISIYGFITENQIHIGCYNNYCDCSSCPERFQGKVYILDRFGELKQWQNGKPIETVSKYSRKYKRIIDNKYLKKLYPDKKLSVKNIYFDSK
jgi:antitoxin component YwqK of YwqJK toxin-antitoxin module